jgi:hypothetical protein
MVGPRNLETRKKKTKRKLKYAPPYIKSFTATPSLLGPFDPKEGPPS